MASINQLIISGVATSEAMQRGEMEYLFHVHVFTGSGTQLWLAVYWRGKKAYEYAELICKGDVVMIEGALAPRDAEFSGAVLVQARNVIFQDHDGQSREAAA